jgi:hypothetical protein
MPTSGKLGRLESLSQFVTWWNTAIVALECNSGCHFCCRYINEPRLDGLLTHEKSSASRGGFNEICRGATEWLVKPAPTALTTIDNR